METLDKALKLYQGLRPKMTFLEWCEGSGYLNKFSKEEKKEAKEISKSLKVQ